MQIKLFCIGKIKKQTAYQEIIDEFLKKLPWKVDIIEIEGNKSKQSKLEVLKLEKELILEKLDTNSFIITLDVSGKHIDSTAFSNLLNKAAISGKKLSFIIGGHYGIDEDLVKMASFNLSLSPMTFNHLLARQILIEQVYRAYSIQNNLPYHK